jgi:photosystem II stability/assembly factor-like uncharacterized protein
MKNPWISTGYVLLTCVVVFIFLIPVNAQKAVKLDENDFGEIQARHIGPAVMSGRIAAIDAVDSDPRIIYVGAAAGGVWKSQNAGTTFKPMFDEHCQSIGAIAIDQHHPDTVWVGTGESWTRNSVSVGDGIYKTVDGGAKWQRMGLEESEHIARIAIHPQNPDTVFVAALGSLWAPNAERGVLKTTNGGKTWENILWLNENTGCSDIAIDPENPDIIYAGMWNFRRQPHFFRSGGPGSGLYRSTDGGKNWQKVTQGMPEGDLGRVAIAISPANPRIVWALIESKKTTLYRSGDRGETWVPVNSDPVVGERPFYFAYLVADPIDTNRIYKPGFNLNVSNDGGKTFQNPYVDGGNVHSDLHALYISKKDNNFLYLGTDGGLYVSVDHGNTWQMKRNLPISQFYRVTADRQRPYNVYGGLQDNGSWYGPSVSPGGISNHDWENVGYGDGFNVTVDPSDNNIIYWQYQGGEIKRYYRDTKEFKDIKPLADGSTEEFRFNWNTPLVFGPSGSLYVGAQYLFRSKNMGDTWERISPDLTTNDQAKLQQEQTGGLTIDNSSAENHCTIYWISESPLDAGTIWAGTDDGNLQLTKDGGATWSNVARNIPAFLLPPGTWCSHVNASGFDKATAFATFDGHRTGDMKPYIFKTTDFGTSWQALSDTTIKGFCHVIKQDIVNPDLLFLGTEFGLFVSIDAGNTWTRFKGKFPKVPVHDIAFQPITRDLVVATHGRGILIIDDLTPIRQMKPEMLSKEIVFLDSRPFELGFTGAEQRMEGDDAFTGANPPTSSIITYYLNKRHVFGDMYIQIFNDQDSLIKTIPAGKRKGINQVEWRLLMDPPKVPSSVQLLGQAMTGPTFPPGEYKVKIIKGENIAEGRVKVVWDPASRHSAADRDLRQEKLMEAYVMLEDLAFIDRQILDIRDKARASAALTTKSPTRKTLSELAARMDLWHAEIVPLQEGQITGEERLRERIANIYGAIMGYQGRPTDSQLDRLRKLGQDLGLFNTRLRDVISIELPAINLSLQNESLPPITVISKNEFLEEK